MTNKHVHTDRNRLLSIKKSGHGNNYIFEFIIMFIKRYSRKDYNRRFVEGIPSAQFSLAVLLMFFCWTLTGRFYNYCKLKEKVVFYFPMCDISAFYLLSSPCHLVFLWRNTRFLGHTPSPVQDFKFRLSLGYTCIRRHAMCDIKSGWKDCNNLHHFTSKHRYNWLNSSSWAKHRLFASIGYTDIKGS